MLVQILDRSRTLDADVLQVQTTSSRFNHAHVCQSVMCTFQIYIYCQHCRNKVEDRADFMVFTQGPSNLDFKPTSIQVPYCAFCGNFSLFNFQARDLHFVQTFIFFLPNITIPSKIFFLHSATASPFIERVDKLVFDKTQILTSF